MVTRTPCIFAYTPILRPPAGTVPFDNGGNFSIFTLCIMEKSVIRRKAKVKRDKIHFLYPFFCSV